MRRIPAALVMSSLVTLSACDEDVGEGTLRIAIYGESFIEEGIPDDVFVDGWSVRYSRFLVAVGDIAADGVPLEGNFVFDLTQPSKGIGHEIGEVTVPTGLVEHLSYRIRPATEGSDGNGTMTDVAMMVESEWSLFAAGVATKGEEHIEFSWGFATDTTYRECETYRTIDTGQTAESQITIHADHLYYDDLESPDANVAFDLIATADRNLDGTVSTDELRALDLGTLSRYQVGSRDVTDLWSYLGVLSQTVGHVDGERECKGTL